MPERPDLPDLVRYVHDEEGVSFGEMSRRAKAAGFKLSKSMCSRWASRDRDVLELPKAETVHAFAAALGRKPDEVFAAAGRCFGFTVYPGLPGDETVFASGERDDTELTCRRQQAQTTARLLRKRNHHEG